MSEEAQALGPPCTPFPATLTGSWIISGTTVPIWDAGTVGTGITCYITMSDANSGRHSSTLYQLWEPQTTTSHYCTSKIL